MKNLNQKLRELTDLIHEMALVILAIGALLVILAIVISKAMELYGPILASLVGSTRI